MTKLLFLYENLTNFTYRVAENEDIFDICKKFNIAPQKLILLNSLTENPKQNSLLYLVRSFNTRLYQVTIFDSLKTISERFNISEQEILEKNAISYIFPFQIIEI